MKRTATWQDDFAAWITRVSLSSDPFVWGVRDCCLIAADGVQTVTGVDIAADFRGKYDSALAATKTIKDVTGTGTEVLDALAYVATKYGLTERPNPLFAQRGELVAVRNGDGSVIAGVVSLNGRDVISMGEEGVMTLPISQAVKAWSY